jgi:hypothetical protein
MDMLWNFSDDELQLGIAGELDTYLQENFSNEKHVSVNVTLHDSTKEARNFLRKRGDQDGGCQFSLDITGDVLFGFDNETSSITRAMKGPEERRSSLEARRSKIYAYVMRSIVNDYVHLATTAPSTHPIEETRKLQSACTSVVKSEHVFNADEFLCSPSGPFFFGYRADGDLGIWKGWRQVWSAGSQSKGTTMRLQGDGNLVVRDGAGSVLWNSMTGGSATSGGEVLIADNGEVSVLNAVANKSLKLVPSLADVKRCVTELNGTARLALGERICSQDERFSFGLSFSGDLGIWFGPKQVWSAGTCCQGRGMYAQLQADGNFVVRSGNGDALWKSGTSGPSMGGAVVNVSITGTVTITNKNEGKIKKLEPSGETSKGNSSVTPVAKSCVKQVDGRIQLRAGQFICSPNGKYRFGTALSGDIQLLDGSTIVWSAGTCCANDGVFALLQPSDGNLVVRTSSMKVLWTSSTVSKENANSTLSLLDSGTVAITNPAGKCIWAKSPQVVCLDQGPGALTLMEGQVICSSGKRFRFGIVKGDLSLWRGNSLVWSAGLRLGSCARVYVRMQGDGNLVVRDGNDKALWSSKTEGNKGASLRLTDDGIPKILSLKGTKLWAATGDAGPPSPSLPPASLAPAPKPSVSLPPPTPTSIPSSKPNLKPVVGQVVLTEGDFFGSPNKQYKFGLTNDGDLALFGGSGRIWSAKTCCSGETVTATLQGDGDLVVRTSTSKVLWSSQTSSPDTDIASLMVGDDGIVTITDTKMGHIWSSAVTDRSRVVPDSLEAKVMAGYQGWFFAANDGGMNQWVHWSRSRTVPNKNTVTIDAWPDLRELDEDELYPTDFRYKDGSNAGLYSAHNAKTVERHTRWMKDYGIDGVFVQRFIGNAVARNWTPAVDKVLANVRSGAEKYGRTFVTMYDIGNGNEASIVQDVINDWKHLVDDEHITKSRQYLHHRGRPLVALWGFGFHDRLGTPNQVAEIIDWFKNKAEDKYKVTLMGGVPAGWRDLSRDSKTGAAWASIFRSYDVISPWTVGRFVDIRTANYFRSRYIEPDMAECKSLGIDYLPVVYPGFSFKNHKPEKPFNEIPRNGGTFMWHQMYNAVAAGSKMIYVAMFDEVDEGTAIFKIAENSQQTPTEGRFITTNMDQGYSNCPNDWYLNITGTVSGLIRNGKTVPLDMPEYP